MVDREIHLQASLPISCACAQLRMLAREIGGCVGYAQLDDCVADCDRHIQQRPQEQVGKSAHPAPTKEWLSCFRAACNTKQLLRR